MRNNIFFSCRDPWVLGNQCIGKGHIHYIEVESCSDKEEEEIMSQVDSVLEDDPTHEPEKHLKKPHT
jgi:hypothetical protein